VSSVATLSSSRRFRRVFPWLAGAVFAAGVIAIVIKIIPGTSGTTNTDPLPNAPPAQVVKPDVRVKLSPQAREVAGKFILTAVQRRHLDQAWNYAGPGIKQGQTYKQWLTGTIAVVPFQGGIANAPMKVSYSAKNEAILEVLLVPQSKANGKNKPAVFWLTLRRYGKPKHWLVDEWIPRVAPRIPTAATGS
jgi:hypothetical protein